MFSPVTAGARRLADEATRMSKALRTACWMILLLAPAAGCIRVADLPAEATAPSEHKALPRRRAENALFHACQNGTAPRDRASACLILAGYFGEGRFGLPQDPERASLLWESAVDILEASCSLGEVADCTGAASAIEMGLGNTQGTSAAFAEEVEWMLQYAEHGCRGGDVAGCALLGRLYERGKGVAADPERALGYYDKACTGGHRQSCLFLASRAEGAAAVRAYERACEAGSGYACATAGQQHRKGAGVPASVEQAGVHFKRGCDLGDPISCVLGAEMYTDDATFDRRRAVELGLSGCKQGIAGSCIALGDMLARTAKPAYAREYYQRACDLGEPLACAPARAPQSAGREYHPEQPIDY